MSPLIIAEITHYIQLAVGLLLIALAVVYVWRLRRVSSFIRIASYVVFGILLCGIAFGDYYAASIARRLAAVVKDQPERAISGYTVALQLAPTDGDLYFRRGLAHFALHQYGQAVDDYTLALQYARGNPKYLAYRGAALLFLHEFTSAERDINEAIQAGYRTPETLMIKGILSVQHGKYEDAIKDYTAALRGKLDPQNRCYALIDRASVYQKSKNYSLALDDFNMAYHQCGSKSDRENVLVDRGVVYAEMNKPDMALADWNHALELDPNDPVVFKNRGSMFLDDGELSDALRDFNRYIALRKDDPYGYTVRAEIYNRLDMQAMATADLKLANELLATGKAHPDSSTLARVPSGFDGA